MFKCVEGNNADRVVELPGQKVGDDSFEVRPLDFRFAVNATQPAKAVDYEVGGLIRAVGHGRWRPVGLTHNTPQNPEFNKTRHKSFRKALVLSRPLAVVRR